jgi:hypothetical protein
MQRTQEEGKKQVSLHFTYHHMQERIKILKKYNTCHATAQVVSHWLPTTPTWVQFQVNSWDLQ